jgi:hypothetical protein
MPNRTSAGKSDFSFWAHPFSRLKNKVHLANIPFQAQKQNALEPAHFSGSQKQSAVRAIHFSMLKNKAHWGRDTFINLKTKRIGANVFYKLKNKAH